MTAVPELLTVPEVMARLKVGRSKVYDLIRASPRLSEGRRLPTHTG